MNQGDADSKLDKLEGKLSRLRRNASRRSDLSATVIQEVLRELQTGLEELRVMEEEIRLQNDELLMARQMNQQQRRRYNELFDLAAVGLLVTDASGIIREANRTAGAMLGISPRLLAGKPLVEFVAPDQRKDLGYQRARACELRRVDGWRVRLQPADGPALLANVSIAAAVDVPPDAGVSLRWTIQDISALERG